MRAFQQLGSVVLLLLMAGCATSVDMDNVNRRVDDNAARLAALEKAQAQRDRQADSQLETRFQAIQKELDALRKELADSKWSLNTLTEKIQSLEAYRQEVEQYIVQFRKKGGELDKAMEKMSNRLEADVRGLSEKLKKYLEEGKP